MPFIMRPICLDFRKSNFIRKDGLVRGLLIQGVDHKINSFADDTNFTLKDYQSIFRVLKIYHCFKQASGATLKSRFA